MRQRLLNSGLLLLTVLLVAFGALSFSYKVRSFSPSGFDVAPRGEVWQVTEVEAERTGLQAGDLVLLVNGEMVASPQELEQRLVRRESSQILVQRGERLVEISYRRPPLRFDWTYLGLALIGVVYLLIGSYTLLRGSGLQVVLFHLWCLASAAVYLLTATPPFSETERLLWAMEELARLVLPPLTLHFFLLFPRPWSAARWFRPSLAFLYLPSAVLLALHGDLMFNQGGWLAGPVTEAKLALLDRAWMGLLVILVGASVAVLATRLRATGSREELRQLLWITLGMAGGYVPFLLLYALPRAAGLEASTWLELAAVVPLALVPLSFAYAILRYRLWDIAIIVRDLVTYTLTLLLGVFVFSLLSLLIDRGVPEDLTLARQLLTVVAGVLVAGLLIPTREGISATLQRFHYRGHFSRRRALSKFGHDLLHERDLQSLSSSLLHELEAGLDLEQANLYLVEGERLVPVLPEPGEQELDLDGLGDRIWERDYESLTGVTLPESRLESAQRLFLLGYRYAFPLTVRERRVGVCVSGYKVEQVPLNSDDLLLVRQLLNQASLAIENAQLLEQLQRQLTEVLELKRFNEEIIESSPAGIAVLDADNRVLTANLAFAALVGRERSAVRRTPLEELLPLDTLPTPDSGLLEIETEDYRGRPRHLQLSAASFLGGSQHGWRVLVVHDVTERVEMERRLKEQERLAALGIMAAGVAHEVNTPLTGISSYAQMLLAQTAEDDHRFAILKKVERQTFRAARIVNSLLQFARQRDTASEPVDVRMVLRECLELLDDRLRDKRIEVEWLDAGPCPPAAGNDNEYHQVFTNLILNAIEALEHRDGGRLKLFVGIEGGWIVARVADNGPGVAPQDLERVFQPFFSTKTQSGGTGLGLSISHEIVRRYGGEMRVHNLDEGGCEFEVRMPAARTGSREAGGAA